jgi:holin-like protein
VIKSYLREIPGLAICVAAFVLADALARRVAVPLPPGIVAALALAALLGLRVLPLAWVAPGGDRLLRHLGVLFVPAAVLALRQRALLAPAIVPLAIIVAVATTVGLIVAGVITERLAARDGAEADDAAAAREEEPGT